MENQMASQQFPSETKQSSTSITKQLKDLPDPSYKQPPTSEIDVNSSDSSAKPSNDKKNGLEGQNPVNFYASIMNHIKLEQEKAQNYLYIVVDLSQRDGVSNITTKKKVIEKLISPLGNLMGSDPTLLNFNSFLELPNLARSSYLSRKQEINANKEHINSLLLSNLKKPAKIGFGHSKLVARLALFKDLDLDKTFRCSETWEDYISDLMKDIDLQFFKMVSEKKLKFIKEILGSTSINVVRKGLPLLYQAVGEDQSDIFEFGLIACIAFGVDPPLSILKKSPVTSPRRKEFLPKKRKEKSEISSPSYSLIQEQEKKEHQVDPRLFSVRKSENWIQVGIKAEKPFEFQQFSSLAVQIAKHSASLLVKNKTSIEYVSLFLYKDRKYLAGKNKRLHLSGQQNFENLLGNIILDFSKSFSQDVIAIANKVMMRMKLKRQANKAKDKRNSKKKNQVKTENRAPKKKSPEEKVYLSDDEEEEEMEVDKNSMSLQSSRDSQSDHEEDKNLYIRKFKKGAVLQREKNRSKKTPLPTRHRSRSREKKLEDSGSYSKTTERGRRVCPLCSFEFPASLCSDLIYDHISKCVDHPAGDRQPLISMTHQGANLQPSTSGNSVQPSSSYFSIKFGLLKPGESSISASNEIEIRLPTSGIFTFGAR